MHKNKSQKIMVVVLEDLVNQSLPRVLSIYRHMCQGEVLAHPEIDFFASTLDRLRGCYHQYSSDPECTRIIAGFAHLLYQVADRAHENEQHHARLV